MVMMTALLLMGLVISARGCGGGNDGPREWVRDSHVADRPTDHEITRKGPNE